MVTKVRISPINQWCSFLKALARGNPRYCDLVGMEVEIETSSMRERVGSDGRGRAWGLTLESTQLMDMITGQGMATEPATVCEHMLEMD